ncbi:MFS transporter [Hansschlegelia beijingensis]|uniref:MFS family permease n=1 Tax=Hansschlegelia beijingensis TaxID=1133344 RepID=A0A7W6D4M6_9HYPH|nr:MFS transporter [Hansschlegelia beijingensis]MBB3974052.1 MFS family permease [Hansschlegelia beijingensis]
MNPGAPAPDDGARWRVLGLVCLALVLSMTTWFSATAVTPELIAAWGLSPADASWLTNMVQLGFVAGALGSSLVNLPDIVAPRKLMAAAAALAALANLSLLVAPSVAALFVARLVTGAALAGVYPPALKLISTWFVRGRGTALGAVIGALTLGSASPHLVRGVVEHIDWRVVVAVASVATLIGAAIFAAFAREGPAPFSRATFDPRQITAVLRNRPLALANIGYFGHMWELYAMWGWFLVFVTAAPPSLGVPSAAAASLITFAVIGVGALGALLGGVLADRIGRTATAAGMMAVSGTCALLIGVVFDGPVWLFAIVALIWGVSVVGDSAQFSAMATEVSDPRYVGTALAVQLGVGFALTILSIRLIPVFVDWVGWRWSFILLTPGPVIGVAAMLALRRRPEARKIAQGLR